MAIPYKRDFDRQAERDRTRGNRAEDAYLDRAENFDARGAARESAGAMYEDFARTLERSVSGLRDSQVGRGRTRTGWGFRKEDELFREGRDQLTRDISQRALDAESLNLRASEGLGAFGQGTTNRYLDILGGQRDAKMLEDERKRRDRAALFGLGGKVAGSLLGPAGAVVGGKLGDAVAGLFN